MTGVRLTTSSTSRRKSAASGGRVCAARRMSKLLFVILFSPLYSSTADVVGRARVRGVGPAVVRDGRRPARPERVSVIRITAQTFVSLGVLGQLVAVEPHAQARPRRHGDGALLVLERAALDDVVREVMIMRVGRERQVG